MFSPTCVVISCLLVIESFMTFPKDPLPRWVVPTVIEIVRDGDDDGRGWAFDVLEQQWPNAQCYAPQLPRARQFTSTDRFVHEVVAEALTDPTWDARAARVLTCIRAPGWDERVVRCAAGGSGRLAAHICHELVLAVADREALASLARHMQATTDDEVRRRLAYGFVRVAKRGE